MSISARIERVRAEDLLEEPVPTERTPGPGISRRRQLAGVALTATVLPLLTLLLTHIRDTLSLEGQVLLYLLAVVVVALVGGLVVALVAAVAAALLINYFFVVPLHTFTIAHADQAVALVVFVAVAAIVSGTVEVAALTPSVSACWLRAPSAPQAGARARRRGRRPSAGGCARARR